MFAGVDAELRKSSQQALQCVLCAFQCNVRHDDDKLFSTVAAHHVGATQALHEQRRKHTQHDVTRFVAPLVVHGLEVVQIEQHNAQVTFLALGQIKQARCDFKQVTSIVQPGQWVAQNLLAQLGLQRFVGLYLFLQLRVQTG